ncbi:MFS transporter [Alphaproteobacteria bacterium]|nr:MFS transporter [Alphaproteobacteria bacterium]
MAFSIGLWTIRIPTIRDQLQTDYLGIGYLMLTFAIGSIIAMLLANYMISKSSSKYILIYVSLLNWLLWLPVPFVKDLEIFMFLAFLFGVCFGLFEICINLQATKIETREKKSMMSGFHAFWSLGVLIGSILTSFFLEWNISILKNILIYFIIMLPINLYFSFKLKKDYKKSINDKKNIFFIWPILIFLLAIIAMANALTEGSVDSWGALYMSDYVQVNGFSVGIATISFNIFMVIGRIYGDWFRDKIGVYNLLTILMILTIISLIILINYNTILSSVLGFALLGIGASSIIPIAYSLVSKIKGIDSGVGITIVCVAVYGTFIGAPACLGLLANTYGVNNIFIPVLIVFIFLLIPLSIYKKEFEL